MDTPFYASGLRFSCLRCSACCRHESGFVFLSQQDLSLLAEELQMEYTAFVKTWCRWVPFERGKERLSLKEKSNYDCIFWNGACTVYHARPLQCRTFPFWDTIVCSPAAWKRAEADCPGVGAGTLHSGEHIEALLRQLEDEPLIERKTLYAGAG